MDKKERRDYEERQALKRMQWEPRRPEPIWVPAFVIEMIRVDQMEQFGGRHQRTKYAIPGPGLMRWKWKDSLGPMYEELGKRDVVHWAEEYLRCFLWRPPWVDGALQIGFLVACVFVELNGFQVVVGEGELVRAEKERKGYTETRMRTTKWWEGVIRSSASLAATR